MSDDPTKLTSQVAHVGDVVKYWLDDLVAQNQDFAETGLPIVVYGPDDNAADAAPPKVTWCPVNEDWQAPQRQGAPGRPGALYTRGIPISFELFGGMPPEGSFTEAEAPFVGTKMTEILMSKLVNVIHRSTSQQSYAIAGVTWFNGGRTGIGMACELVVQVKLPLIREDNPTVTITGATAHAEIAHE